MKLWNSIKNNKIVSVIIIIVLIILFIFGFILIIAAFFIALIIYGVIPKKIPKLDFEEHQKKAEHYKDRIKEIYNVPDNLPNQIIISKTAKDTYNIDLYIKSLNQFPIIEGSLSMIHIKMFYNIFYIKLPKGDILVLHNPYMRCSIGTCIINYKYYVKKKPEI